MYKTKETAIRHLESLRFEDFRHKNFNLFRDNEEVALIAIKRNYNAIEGVSDRLKNSVEFNRQAFEANSDVYLIQRSNKNVMHDREILKCAAKCDRFPYFESSTEHGKDRELAMIAAKANGGIAYLSDEFKNDREIVLAGVSRNGWNLGSVTSVLKADKEIVLAAVRQSSMAISHASKDIQDLCKGQDPVKVLESTIAHEKLQSTLAQKAPAKRPTQSLKL